MWMVWLAGVNDMSEPSSDRYFSNDTARISSVARRSRLHDDVPGVSHGDRRSYGIQISIVSPLETLKSPGRM